LKEAGGTFKTYTCTAREFFCLLTANMEQILIRAKGIDLLVKRKVIIKLKFIRIKTQMW